MADIILGTQGSGKTLFSVKKIVDDVDKYDSIFTNISDFKYDKNPKYRELVPSRFFEDVVSVLYQKYKVDNNISDIKQKELFFEMMDVKYNIGRILIVIDEAHNFLGKKNDVVQWFSTYHRHLNVDYFLITQLLTSIQLDNRIFNNIYQAYPVSRQFFPNSLRYKHYFALPLTEANFNKSFSIRKEQKYFDIYHSGDILKSDKKGIISYVFLFFGLLLLLVFGFRYFLGNFGSSSSAPDVPSVSKEVSEIKRNRDKSENDSKNLEVFTYFVDIEKKILYCFDNLKSIPLPLLPNPIYFESKGVGFVTYFYHFKLNACSEEVEQSDKDHSYLK